MARAIVLVCYRNGYICADLQQISIEYFINKEKVHSFMKEFLGQW